MTPKYTWMTEEKYYTKYRYLSIIERHDYHQIEYFGACNDCKFHVFVKEAYKEITVYCLTISTTFFHVKYLCKKDMESVLLCLLIGKKNSNILLNSVFHYQSVFDKNWSVYWAILFVVYDLLLKQLEEEDVQIIIQHWIRILNIKLGWIHDFDKLVVKYVMFLAVVNPDQVSKFYFGHTSVVFSIDYSTFDGSQFLCSASEDKTVCVWDIETNKQIQLFNGHSDCVNCVKFSPYHYYNNRRNVICSSSHDKTIRFWDIKDNQQFQIFNVYADGVCGIELSPFNCSRYLCSGSFDNTVRLWDIETSKSFTFSIGIQVLCGVWIFHPCKVITIKVIVLEWLVVMDIQFVLGHGIVPFLIVFEGHEYAVWSVKYGSNGLGNIGGVNTILSGSYDKSVRLWDIRSGQQIQAFYGHIDYVNAVEYSPFAVNNTEIGGSSNVICSGSWDNTIRFWDIRSNKELYVIKGDYREDSGILCLKFLGLKKKEKKEKTMVVVVLVCVTVHTMVLFVFGDDIILFDKIIFFFSCYFFKAF
ncbi:G-protein beta WD-40 repeats containing protein [Reticulomyxa filosa]|uniref:G-protein beta WD-40 repeats containing protein n=1 Tax=Reticulomyxa filosa TaxID=46433 RepID=X6NJ12_RETFI|nr:G-protein beta WD-40 repeats containing protein [Reticulomyxa filosa]|eukprot:ETO25971.1 G-protein beta WD-40 repeats containing protein [Reticulomyxa filosa]